MIYLFLGLLLVCCVFRQWFAPGFIAAGDLWPPAIEVIRELSLQPIAWNHAFGAGLGGSSIPFLWNYYQYAIPIFFYGKLLHLSWEYIVRFGYLFPFLILSVYCSYTLAKKYLGASLSWLSALIYTTNTYILLIISGGQTGVAMAYAFSPFVLLKFIQRENKELRTRNKELITNGLWLSLLIAFDLRIAYLVMGAVVLYGVLNKKLSIVHTFFTPLFIAVLVHAYWILPTIVYRGAVTDIGSAYTGSGMLQFLSFADFSHAISFLHPNWPENLFGKVYFLQPEFLILPILAFLSLIFLSRNQEPCLAGRQARTRNHHHVLYFALLALVGAFFAKGVNPPAGAVFQWVFTYVPGFVLFRDPTKFYLYIALAYSVLIPFTIKQIASLISIKYQVSSIKYKRKIHDTLYIILYTAFIGFWCFTIRQAVAGTIQGTLQHAVVPTYYKKFEKQLARDPAFSRTFWIPQVHRFSLATSDHPALDAMTVTGQSSASGIIQWMREPLSQEQLSRWSTAYVVVPIDVTGEMFLTDRKYDDAKRNEAIREMDAIPWLTPVIEYQHLAVWKTEEIKPHLWIEGGPNLQEKRINAVTYEVDSVEVNAGDRIIFSEQYNPLWVVRLGDVSVRATPTKDKLNAFVAQSSYAGPVTISYLAQRSVDVGLAVGLLALIISVVSLFVL